jgi:hypothetical protein
VIQLKYGVTIIRFSPRSEVLAVGVAGKSENTANVNIYDVNRNFELS